MADVAQAVTRVARKDLAGQAHRTQLFRIQAIAVCLQVIFDKGVIKVHIVRYKHRTLQHFIYFGRDFFKGRCLLHHFVVDARKGLDVLWNGLKWVHQRFKRVYHSLTIKKLDGNLNDAVCGGIPPGGLDIYNGKLHTPKFDGGKKKIEGLKKSSMTQTPADKFQMFENRLTKVYRHVSKLAARQGISCFRVYDHDLPEAPFLIEKYADALYVSEYQRRFEMSDEAHAAWLEHCKTIMSNVTGVAAERVYVRLRKRKENRLDQYQKLEGDHVEFEVAEAGLRFIVNLTDYLDTGLFLDHRITRSMVREWSRGMRVLNLFCYTGSFSVYAAAGGAAEVVSVDLSNTYLKWAERNMMLNFPDAKNVSFIQADVLQYLSTLPDARFDLIILDPPTFSNSKRMQDFFDVQQHHVRLINDCLRILTNRGILVFSTNYTKFQLNSESISASEVKDITKATTAFDFVGKLHRQCFKIIK
jgi:23S rRNA (cytosine1962-C5)-methyltransferase